MKNLILLLYILFFTFPADAKRSHPEKYYQEQFCTSVGGQMEVVLSDKTRVDCLTNEYAYEVDFANKWAECTGQALHYGKMTGKKPACLLIIEKESDKKYLNRVQTQINTDIRLEVLDERVTK